MSAHIKTYEERLGARLPISSAAEQGVAMRAEIAELRAALRAQQGVERQAYDALSSERDEYKQRAEAAEQDAERYRWLRSDDIGVDSGEREICVYLERLPFREDQSDELLTEQALDVAVDAALAARMEG